MNSIKNLDPIKSMSNYTTQKSRNYKSPNRGGRAPPSAVIATYAPAGKSRDSRTHNLVQFVPAPVEPKKVQFKTSDFPSIGAPANSSVLGKKNQHTVETRWGTFVPPSKVDNWKPKTLTPWTLRKNAQTLTDHAETDELGLFQTDEISGNARKHRVPLPINENTKPEKARELMIAFDDIAKRKLDTNFDNWMVVHGPDLEELHLDMDIGVDFDVFCNAAYNSTNDTIKGVPRVCRQELMMAHQEAIDQEDYREYHDLNNGYDSFLDD
jgi:hypothetical protein